MNKSHLTLAVLALAAGAASAQSSVTLYGRVDLGLVVDDGAAGKSVRLSSGVAKGSSIGVRGQEDLGGGWKTAFKLESGYCADSAAPVTSSVSVKNSNGAVVGTTTQSVPNFCSGSNNFMGRQARGDLIGPFGTLSAGRQFSMGYQFMLATDAFLGTAGQMNNLMDPSGFRLNNSVRYTTPVFGGFYAAAEMALGEQTGAWTHGRETGASLFYESGRAKAGLTYNKVDNSNGIGASKQNVMLGGTYDFGVVKLHAMLEKTTGAPTGAARIDQFDVMGGISAPLAGGRLAASYVRLNDRTAADKDGNQLAVGYYYPLSKRVLVYTAYGRIVDENGAKFLVGNATENGVGDKSFNLGVGYDF